MKRRLESIRSAGALLLAGLAAGCAGDLSEQALYTRPGRFDYLSCPEIVTATQSAVRHEQELKTLIERAEKDAFGSLIATASYRGDYLKAQADQKMLAEVSARKNCPPDTPPAPPPAKPKAKPKAKQKQA